MKNVCIRNTKTSSPRVPVLRQAFNQPSINAKRFWAMPFSDLPGFSRGCISIPYSFARLTTQQTTGWVIFKYMKCLYDHEKSRSKIISLFVNTNVAALILCRQYQYTSCRPTEQLEQWRWRANCKLNVKNQSI